MLLGNMSDLEHRRQVSFQDAEEFAQSNNLLCFKEVTAKQPAKLQSVFMKYVLKLLHVSE
jgi:hypothetical protein